MTTQVNELLTEFEQFKISEKDSTSQRKLNQLTERMTKIDSEEVTSYFTTYLNQGKYINEKDQIDFKLPHILKIIEHYQNPNCLPQLIKLSEDKRVYSYLKLISHTIGQFKTEMSRMFLRKHLANKPLAYLCAIALAYFPDPSGELILLDTLRENFERKHFIVEPFYALVYLRNSKIWLLLKDFLSKQISERERYKVCIALLKLNDSKTIPFIIDSYHYYAKHSFISYKEVKAISLEDENLFLTKAHRESIPFLEKIKIRIINKLKLYHSDFRVKTLFKQVQNEL